MEKFLQFVSQQWLLVTALTATAVALAWLEQRRAGRALDPHALTALINSQSVALIDLRDKAEFDAGHIVGATHLSYAQWQAQGDATELDKYRDRPLVLVCKMGHQSSAVAKRLSAQGEQPVYRLNGGVMAWQHAQMPLVK